MALSDNRLQRTSMMCALYVAQGIPWGFMATAVVSYLTQHGINTTEAGKLTAIVLVPWSFKLVWAPLIDTMTIRSMGRRRPWIIGAELLMAFSLLGLLALGDIRGNLQLLGWMFFLHNCFASLQDVATDALAVDIVPPEEQGLVNGLMWGSKLLGKGFGAGALAVVMDRWGFSAAVWVQFVCLILIMLFPLLMVERPGEGRMPWSGGKPSDDAAGVRSLKAVLRDLWRAYSLPTCGIYVAFSTLSIIGWGMIEVLVKPLYTQDLNWTAVAYSKIEGMSVFIQMAGAVAGGLIADRIGRRFAMVLGFGAYGLMAVAFGLLPGLWNNQIFASGYLLLNPGVLALGSVGFLSMAMRISWTQASATVFTIYMTLSNVSHVLGNWTIGPIRDDWKSPYETCFILSGCVMLLPLLLLPLIRPQQVDDAVQKTLPA